MLNICAEFHEHRTSAFSEITLGLYILQAYILDRRHLAAVTRRRVLESSHLCRVPLVVKLMEFSKTILQAWKVMYVENSKNHGKSWKTIKMSCDFYNCTEQ